MELQRTHFALFAAFFLNCACGSEEDVVIRKVGYPEARVQELSACGQRAVRKSILDPDYFYHTFFGGFHEGTCAAIGYKHFEEKVTTIEHPFPLAPNHSYAFDVYTRDPTQLDIASCVSRECTPQLKALGSSSYVKDAQHCVSPAFGPCVPKAWDCLGDEVCREALECLPEVVHECSEAVWNVVTDPAEREKLACVWKCNHSKACVLERCGLEAVECLTGVGDPLCHKAVTCVPQQMKACSKSAFDCVFAEDGACRENLACLAKGANVCADPTVNLLTDRSISDLLYCANHHCPAPVVESTVDEHELRANGNAALDAKGFPSQLACMGAKCGSKVVNLFADKDIQTLSTCFVPSLEGCHETLWRCLGNETCKSDIRCWVEGISEYSMDIYKMISDHSEREFDEELYNCVADCTRKSDNVLKRSFCLATHCGPRSAKCMLDTTCRHVFTELPFTLAKCGVSSAKDPQFREASECVAQIANACGLAGIELVRDEKLADLVVCNSQCARPTKEEALFIAV
jgi:hypothetical protein